MISICVPIYQAEAYIERCILSIVQQRYADWELLLVDDESKDASVAKAKEVLARYPQVAARTQWFIHPTNRGLASARLTALTAAKGDYILHVDGDDWLEDNALEVLAQAAEQTGADIIWFNTYFDWGNQRKEYKVPFTEDPMVFTQRLLNCKALPAVWLYMAKRRLYTDYAIAPIPGMNMGEDYAVTPRLAAAAHSIAYVPQALHHYFKGNNQSLTAQSVTNRIEGMKQALEILEKHFSSNPAYIRALREGQWSKKMELLLMASKDQYAALETIMVPMPIQMGSMTKAQKVGAWLLCHHLKALLPLFAGLYRWVMNSVQKMKGRK